MMQKQAVIDEMKVLPEIDVEYEVARRVSFIKKQLLTSGLNSLVLGISGGRDNNEVLIVASDPLSNANTISGITGSLIFDEQGGIDRAATITLCPNNNDANYASALLLSLYGRISVAVDSDDNGKKEDLEGNELSCS